MGSQQSIFAAVATLILGEANEKKLKKIVDEEKLKELKQPPNLDEAKKLRAKYSVADIEADSQNPKPYNIFLTSPKDLGKYGVGLELYFLFLKQMATLFFIIACISIYPAYNNSEGTWISDDESQNGARFTLANPYWLKKGDRCIFDLCKGNITEARKFEIKDEINENYKETWMADAIYTCIFLFGLIIILIVNKIKINHNTLGNDRVADYSVEVGGFPDESIDIVEVFDHFKNFKIVEIYLGRAYGDLLYFYREKAEVLKKIKIQQIFLEDSESEENNKKMKKLQTKLYFLNKIIENSDYNKLHHLELPVNRAYIIFESQEDRAKVITKYRKKCCFFKKNDPSLKFKGKYDLKIYKSTEPSDIIWENLQMAYWERVSRIAFSVIIVVILMSISVGLIFLMKQGSQDTYDTYRCLHDNKENEMHQPLNHVLANHSNWDSDSPEMQCWCSQQPASDWAQKPQIRSMCMDYVMKKLSSAAINFFICCGIVIINYSLRHLFTMLSEFERRKSYNIKQTHLMLKIFAAMLANTAVVPIIVHLSFHNDEQEDLIDRQFNDVTKYWYVKVGSMFYIMMCINVVSPHLIFNFLVIYMTGLWKRFRSYLAYKTQYEINNAFLGPDFRLAARTSMILTVIFTCFIFSGGIPLLNIIAFVALFVIYWTDKFLVLRHYRKPPYYSHHVYSNVIKVMPLCVFFHSCFSLIAYGCPDVFPMKLNIISSPMLGGYYATWESQSLEERIKMDHGIMFSILILTSLVLFLLFIFSESITKECKRILLLNGYGGNKLFENAKQNIKKYAITTYDLEKNPNYAYLIKEMIKDEKIGRFGFRRSSTVNRLTIHNGRKILTSSCPDELQYLNQDGYDNRANRDRGLDIRQSKSCPNLPLKYSENSKVIEYKTRSIDLNGLDNFYFDEKNDTSVPLDQRMSGQVFNEEGSQSILVGNLNESYIE